jgi:uncharacterized membrane protein YhaH (DUF805 family)
MEFLKKLFNFSGTINGIEFLWRWVVANIIQLPGGFMIGYGIAGGIMGFTMLGLIIGSVGIALQFSTLMKRSRALFKVPNYLYYYIAYLLVSIVQGFAGSINEYISILSNIVMLAMFVYAIAKNSGIPKVNHEG